MQLADVTRNYDRAAKHYDKLTDVVFGGILGVEKYRKRTVELLGDLAGKTVLDVGAGTGRNLPLLMPRVGPEGSVIALDYSTGMLQQARQRVRDAGWENVRLLQGDAARLAGVTVPVDAIISVWCYGIVHDLPAALRRAVEVLRPGGRFAIMDFDRARPDHGVLHWLYPTYSLLLRWAGIDSKEDLDDARLRDKWRRGRELLDSLLTDVQVERYLAGGGFVLAGRKPG